MPEQQDRRVQSQSHFTAYYSEQETAQYCRLDLHVIHQLVADGVISGVQVVGEEQRRYDATDLAVLRRVRRLYQDLSVNLEGIEIILRLAERIENLQREIARHRAPAEQRLADQPAPPGGLDNPEWEAQPS